MSDYKLDKNIDNEKCFILKRSELEKRIDPFYYIPSVRKLENNVLNQGAKSLRHFIKKVSSGATPKTIEKEKYYSDKENGIPFLRVQNLSPTGFLELDNCKYINQETHNNYLKRSQVKGGDLLIKITGVGRMAVSSVAPDGFEGNTNQHMVVAKTENKKTSEILASYLNTDIGEKLASRRSTGGTRPALDYPALLSIPIIYNEEILQIYNTAILEKQEKELEAKNLINSIDNYLLNELEIVLPKLDDHLNKRIFEISLSEISGYRFDPNYYSYSYEAIIEAISKSNVKDINPIGSVVSVIQSGKTPASSEYSDEISEFPIIKAGSYTNEYIDLKKLGYTKNKNNLEVKKGDIFILSAAHQSQYVGKQIKLLNDEVEQSISYVGELICIRAIKDLCNPIYLFNLLGLNIFKTLLNREKTGQTSHIYGKDIKHIKIPLPPIERQNEIAEHIQLLRDNAKQLQLDAEKKLVDAKKEIEKLILGI